MVAANMDPPTLYASRYRGTMLEDDRSCVDCGAPIPRRATTTPASERCAKCQHQLDVEALRAFAPGTQVIVGAQPGEVIAHRARAVVVRLREGDRFVQVRPEALRRSLHQPNIDERLPAHDCLAFGVSENEAQLFESWLVNRLGLVFCPRGPIGSGVFVSMRHGRVCLLTADHVIDPGIDPSSLAVVPCSAEPTHDGLRPSRSTSVDSVRRSTNADAALIVMPRSFDDAQVLPFDEWRPDNSGLPTSSDALVSAGAPSDYVGEIDVRAKVLERLKVELLWSRLVGVKQVTRELQIRASRYLTGVSSFEGMSGGPVFSVQTRRLVGINASQEGGFVDGIINVSPRAIWTDLALGDDDTP